MLGYCWLFTLFPSISSRCFTHVQGEVDPAPTNLSPLHCFLDFITGVVYSIPWHITPIFYPLLSFYLIIWPPQPHSFLDPADNPSPSPPQQESYYLSTLFKKWLGGWIFTVNSIYIQRLSYLFSKGWYFKYHIIHSCSLKPFCLPPTAYHKKE